MKPNENHAYDLQWQARREESARLKARKTPKKQQETGDREARRRDALAAALAPVGALTGVVIETQRYHAVVQCDAGLVPCALAESSGAVDGAGLVVGDRVTLDLENERGLLRQVLPRTTQLVRLRGDWSRRSGAGDAHVVAANVDVAVIVAAAASPPFHPRFIDRYLIMCQYGGVAPIICVNKCDLGVERPSLAAYERAGVPVVFASAATGEGLDELRAMLRGKSAVLTGQSGVGKSSILNRLLGDESLRVGLVSDGNSRGRHTTTSSVMKPLEGGGAIIDTPGIRSLGLWQVDRASLRWYFPEFEEWDGECRFRDCAHMDEPACAVRDASVRGDIAPARYESYRRIMGE
ncbi:MAG: ribosome small subunit-dependent GTPase A [Chloroflexi bacterium]|nr:ribosome small subunit-dependent GTPase A [Chloroflexota bacterium]